mmetsp:Transcript_56073/g.63986  ORF Transcript_56073/g.63986 Transcript_56073/m.63986 type:complete len:118 (-) Transcript_56073:285-638(-)
MSFFLIASVIIGKMLKMSWPDWCIDFKTMTASSPNKLSHIGSKVITIEALLIMIILSYFNQAHANRSSDVPLPAFMWFLCLLCTSIGMGLSILQSWFDSYLGNLISTKADGKKILNQ